MFYKSIKKIIEFCTNTIIVEKEDLEIDIEKYKQIVFIYKPKKKWFEDLHISFLQGAIKNEEELLLVLKKLGITEKEFDDNYDLFKKFRFDCMERYNGFLCFEAKHLSIKYT